MYQQVKRLTGQMIEKVGSMFYDNQYVTYKMYSGLGNRLRHHCMASAYALMTGRKLVTSWERNEACFATFNDLFQPTVPSMDTLPSLERWLVNRWLWHPEYRNCYTIDKDALSGRRGVEALPVNISERVVHIPEELETYITSSDRLGKYYTQVIASLIPRPEFQQEVDRVISGLPFPRIGIHIRSGDFPPEDSGIAPPFPGAYCPPASRFVEIIRTIQQVHPNASFVLVSNAEKDFLEPLFSSFTIHKREVTNRRDSVQGIKDALVDMLLLANCNLIVGTPFSSFNEFAAFWKNKPLVWASKNEWKDQLDRALAKV